MPAHVGLKRTGLPTDLCHLLQDEDEIEDTFEGMSVDSNQSGDDENLDDTLPLPPSNFSI